MLLRAERQKGMEKIAGAFLQIFFGNAPNEYTQGRNTAIIR
jgi:hypothetical protein